MDRLRIATLQDLLSVTALGEITATRVQEWQAAVRDTLAVLDDLGEIPGPELTPEEQAQAMTTRLTVPASMAVMADYPRTVPTDPALGPDRR